MAKARLFGLEEDRQNGLVRIDCPGCKTFHIIATKKPFENGACWGFNGDFDKPTFMPSLLIRTGLYAGGKLYPENDPKYPHAKEDNAFLKASSSVCHSFITNGKIQFLGDCTHELKCQTVELPEVK